MARDANTSSREPSTIRPGTSATVGEAMTTDSSLGEPASLGSAAGRVSAATLASRILGLVREQITAIYFGAGNAADAFNIAFRVPNLLRDLFAEGALSAAFVPTFTKTLRKEGESEAWRLGGQVVNALLLVLSAIVVVGWFAVPAIVSVMAPGFDEVPGKIELTVRLARWMLPFLLFVALAAAATGMLNSFHRFTTAAMAPLWFNVGTILVTIALVPVFEGRGIDPILALATGVLAGGFLQLAFQLPTLFRLGWRPAWPPNFRHAGVRRIGVLMAPAAIGLSATQINVVINSWLASLVGTGAVSWLAYSFRVLFVPIGLFGVALATVSLPTLSRNAADEDWDALKRNLGRALGLTAALSFPAAVGLVVLSRPLITLLYEHGRFTSADSVQTANALIAYCIGLAAYSGIKVLVPAFYAMGDTKTPVKASFLALFVNVGLGYGLMQIWGHVGLALAIGLTSIFNFVQLWWWLRRRIGALPLGRLVSTGSRTLLASLCMGIVLYAGVHLTRPWWQDSIAVQIALVGISIPLGAVLVLWLYGVFRVEEREELMQTLRSLLGRFGVGR